MSLSSWTSRRLASGLVLYPREGRDAGMIRVLRRVSPRVPRRALVQAVMQRLAPSATVEPLDHETFASAEGEHVAMSTLGAAIKSGGAPFEIVVGAVYGDESYTSIDAVCYRAELFDAFRSAARYVAYNTVLGLGARRQRPYLYTPPRGWGGLPDRGGELWITPDAPDDSSTICVRDAEPFDATPQAVIARIVGEAASQRVRLVSRGDPEPISSEHGLSGTLSSWDGERLDEKFSYSLAVLLDYRYAHVLRLETRPEAHERHLEPFLSVVESCHPVPPGGVSELNVLFDWTPL